MAGDGYTIIQTTYLESAHEILYYGAESHVVEPYNLETYGIEAATAIDINFAEILEPALRQLVETLLDVLIAMLPQILIIVGSYIAVKLCIRFFTNIAEREATINMANYSYGDKGRLVHNTELEYDRWYAQSQQDGYEDDTW